jgi:hypothetical protein
VEVHARVPALQECALRPLTAFLNNGFSQDADEMPVSRCVSDPGVEERHEVCVDPSWVLEAGEEQLLLADCCYNLERCVRNLP